RHLLCVSPRCPISQGKTSEGPELLQVWRRGKGPPSRVRSCAVELGASGKPVGAEAGAGSGAEPSFQHHEVGGPASQQQRPEQHRVAEQHKGQQLPQHLEEVDGKGIRHGSPGSLGLAAPCPSWKQRNKNLLLQPTVAHGLQANETQDLD
ncbi:hypothetical protein Nmel_015333, partial [Mimus melanotis]